MKEYKINLTDQFLEELDSSLYFFSSYMNRRKWYKDVRNIVSSLSFFPERYGQINKNLKAEKIRKLPINKFVIIYKVDNENDDVYVLHIFSQNQDYLNEI